MVSEPLLSVKLLTKNYGKNGQFHVIKGINLSVSHGDFVVITGKSGSGKSTLLNLLSGLEKPTSGKILYNGNDISKFSDSTRSNFRNKTIGFIFQSYNLQSFLSVYDNIAVPAYLQNKPKSQIKSKVNLLLKAVGLEDKKYHQISELSGGQCQRVAIARALVNNPSIIFADEPTGNLDSANTINIISLLRHINKNLGITIILVTHETDFANIADQHLTIQDGELV